MGQASACGGLQSAFFALGCALCAAAPVTLATAGNLHLRYRLTTGGGTLELLRNNSMLFSRSALGFEPRIERFTPNEIVVLYHAESAQPTTYQSLRGPDWQEFHYPRFQTYCSGMPDGTHFFVATDGEGHNFTIRDFKLYLGYPGLDYQLIRKPKPVPKELPPLPQTTPAEWKRANPAYYRNWKQANPNHDHGGPTFDPKIEEYVGPYQTEGKKVWFGKAFSQGEGFSGLGGFGYFDRESKAYRIYAPRQIQDYTASAILVEPGAIWLGLAQGFESYYRRPGIARWDRTTEKITRIPLQSIVNDFVRCGADLCMATEHGLAVWTGAEMREYFINCTRPGECILSRRTPQ